MVFKLVYLHIFIQNMYITLNIRVKEDDAYYVYLKGNYRMRTKSKQYNLLEKDDVVVHGIKYSHVKRHDRQFIGTQDS